MKKRVGIVADDITGGNDIGIMFAKSGYVTGLFPCYVTPTEADFEGLDVVILDTDSRFDSKEVAYQKVFAATKLLMETGFSLYHNKTCSVFRGNIGAEFDGMQDALGQKCSMVIAGFPKNGRTTVGGIHYLNGKRLDESELINDPVHPTNEPSLLKIIAKQSDRKSVNFSQNELDLPLEKQRELLQKLKEEFSYIVFDVRDQSDLKKLAELVKDERNICGSSAIGEELPNVWGEFKSHFEGILCRIEDKNGALMLVGSLTKQTFEQVEYLKESGYVTFSLDTRSIFEPLAYERLIDGLIAQITPVLSSGKTVLLHTANQKSEVEETKRLGRQESFSDEQIGKLVSSGMSKIAKAIHQATGCKKIIVAGGDTSAAVSEALSLKKMVILEEIEAGVPTMYGYRPEGEKLLLVFKSGSFGSKTFLKKAEESLKTLQQRGEQSAL